MFSCLFADVLVRSFRGVCQLENMVVLLILLLWEGDMPLPFFDREVSLVCHINAAKPF